MPVLSTGVQLPTAPSTIPRLALLHAGAVGLAAGACQVLSLSSQKAPGWPQQPATQPAAIMPRPTWCHHASPDLVQAQVLLDAAAAAAPALRGK